MAEAFRVRKRRASEGKAGSGADRITVYMPVWFAERVRGYCEERGLSMSGVTKELWRVYMERGVEGIMGEGG